MRIYLAGGVTGNLYPLWKEFISNGKDAEKAMKVFLAGTEHGLSMYINPLKIHKQVSVLESFYYIDKESEKYVPLYKDYILDSGAFTFFSAGKHVDWDSYLRQYAEYITRCKIDKFFELDIDKLVGREKVIEMTKRLEIMTGKKPIPVWHKFRGLDDFRKMCQEYPYVAIGGIVSREIKPKEYNYLPTLIKIAHDYGCKIHGLGFTKINLLNRIHWDSVDSTAWTTGNRFGFVYKFKNGKMVKYDAPKGYGVNGRITAINNFMEWVKFQQWAEEHL